LRRISPSVNNNNRGDNKNNNDIESEEKFIKFEHRYYYNITKYSPITPNYSK